MTRIRRWRCAGVESHAQGRSELAAGISLFDRLLGRRVRDARYLGMPPLSIVDRPTLMRRSISTTDEDGSPEIQFKEGQRCTEWTCSRPRNALGVPRLLTTKQICG
jgi:hypothetical protein